MSRETFFVVFAVGWASSFIPLTIFFIRGRNAATEIRILVSLIMLSVIFDAVGYASAVYFRTNALTNNIYNLFSFGILSWFYAEILFKKHYKGLFITGAIVYTLAVILITLFFQNFLTDQQSFAWSLGNLILVVYAVLYLHHMLVTFPTNNLNTFNLLWINSAIMLCHGFAILIFLVNENNFRVMSRDKATLIWSFFNFSLIVRNILFAVGIYFSFGKPLSMRTERQ